jgi:hypothetical protein
VNQRDTSPLDRKAAIITGLKKTGFDLEIVTGMRFSGSNWIVQHQAIFQDEDKRKARNVDLFCRRAIEKPFLSFKRLNYTAVVECKKSQNAWVFYTPNSPRLEKEMDIAAYLLKAVSNPMLSPMQMQTLCAHGHYFHKKPTERIGQAYNIAFGTGSQQGRKKKKGKDLFFTALNQVLKALRYERGALLSFPYQATQGLLVVFYPLIVFEGEMYECVLDANEEPQLKETEYVKYETSFLGSWQPLVGQYAPEYFLVDVISKRFLPTYISWLEEEINAILALKPAD